MNIFISYSIIPIVLFLAYMGYLLNNKPVYISRKLGIIYYVNFFILFVHVFATTVLFEKRDDASALIQDGLSTQNQIQVVISLFAAIWASVNIFTRRVMIRELISGPSYWLTCLILLYGVSAVWSIWPELTIFRFIEIFSFWIISFHVFSNTGWLRNLRLYLYFYIFCVVAGSVVGANEMRFSEGLIGAIRSNTGGTAVAMLLIIRVYYNKSYNIFFNSIFVLFLILIMAIFGALAALISLVIAIVICSIRSQGIATRSFVRLGGVIGGGVIGVLFAAYGANSVLGPTSLLVRFLSSVSGKPEALILTLSGRLPFWEALFDRLLLDPWGMGYAAGERLISIALFSSDLVGWSARHAHSGYVAAWVGAGWAGLFLLLALFYSMWIKRDRVNTGETTVYVGLLIVLVVNNITIGGVGGIFNPAFLAALALLAAPFAATDGTKQVTK